MPRTTWLVRNELDRERLIDMERRLQPPRRIAFAVLGVALVICGPWLGWWTLIPLALAAGLFKLADVRVPLARRPELGMFLAWVGSEVVIAGSVALSGGAGAPTLSWLAIPVVTLSARFSGRGIAAGVAIALVLLLATALGVSAGAVAHDPAVVLTPGALIVAVAILSTALMHSDLEHRNEALFDELTGMLNRKALLTRVREIEQQTAISGEPVAIVLADLDRFKAINDTFGHAAGDLVLRDVAGLMRQQLSAAHFSYRLGGEEFIVLLPGFDRSGAAALAEGLRAAVRAGTVNGGRHVTMSCGVAASQPGAGFDYERVFSAADAALYEAKRSGRDRVCGAAGGIPIVA
jgi:diguanylate cyclase (GGDEF)-like protein